MPRAPVIMITKWRSSKYIFCSLWFYPTGPRTHDLPDLPNRASNPRSTGFTQPGLEPTIYRIYPTGPRTHDLPDLPQPGLEPTIYRIYPTGPRTHDLPDLPNRASNPRSTGFTQPGLEPTINRTRRRAR